MSFIMKPIDILSYIILLIRAIADELNWPNRVNQIQANKRKKGGPSTLNILA